jgi:D-threo-aldose 1-dehydrogenase
VTAQASNSGQPPFASRIGFGASGIGTMNQLVSEGEAEDVLERAYAAGIRNFDTAPFYGYGLSELRLGRFLRQQDRRTFTVSTKVGRVLVPPRGEPIDRGIWAAPLEFKPVFDYTYAGTLRALEQSANRLGFSDIDLVHIHDVDRYTHGAGYERMFEQAMDGCYRALDELRTAGHIRAIGVGVNESDTAARFVRTGKFDVVMIAGHYTLLDHDALDELLPEAARRGTAVVAAAIFNSGILAAERAVSASATYNYQPAPSTVNERVAHLAEICAKHSVPVGAAALQFPLHNPAIAAVILGMIRPEHVDSNLAWASASIPDALWDDLRAAGLLRIDAPTGPLTSSLLAGKSST